MPLMNCLCGTSGVNDVNKGCPVHGRAAQLNLRWVQTDELEQGDPAGMIVVGTEEFSDYRVLAQEVDKDIGEMIVRDVAAHDDLLAVCKALDLFQKTYERGTMGDSMPGNEMYADRLMKIVESARAAIAKCRASESANTEADEASGARPNDAEA